MGNKSSAAKYAVPQPIPNPTKSTIVAPAPSTAPASSTAPPALAIEEPEPVDESPEYRNHIRIVKVNRGAKGGPKPLENNLMPPSKGSKSSSPLSTPSSRARASALNIGVILPKPKASPPPSPKPNRDPIVSSSAQASQFPTPQFSPQTAEWSGYFDAFHVQHLLNANSSTINEIWGHYDMDSNRILNRSEVKLFARDLVNRVCRHFAEGYIKTNPSVSPETVRKKVKEEKPYMLPGKHGTEEESIKSMGTFIRSVADVNKDGKVSNSELNLAFTVIMKKLFGEEDKDKKGKHNQTSPFSCNIQ